MLHDEPTTRCTGTAIPGALVDSTQTTLPRAVGMTSTSRIRWAVLSIVAGISAFALGAFAATRPADALQVTEDSSVSPIVEEEQEGFRYSYHVPTGAECLVELGDRSRGVRNVIADHPDVAERLRNAARARLGVTSLESLRAGYADTIRRLEALGYL